MNVLVKINISFTLHSSIDKPDSKFHDVDEENIHDREQYNVNQRLVHVDC